MEPMGGHAEVLCKVLHHFYKDCASSDWYPQGSSLPQMLMDNRRTVHAYFRILEHVRRITDNFHFRIWCWPTLSDT